VSVRQGYYWIAKKVAIMVADPLTISLDLSAILLWAFIGLVAGFLASKVMLGHGMGLMADVAVGILGALLAGFLAQYFGVVLSIPGHPIISEIVIAFIGAVVLLMVLRVFGMGRRRRMM
jgi:uncharacterized membrane protein YeaQ/YmgE (transglycosylase-associated protein family)